ncbi:hypothetical protein DFH11DRAFT_1724511 [Phellopilus nigrolimitatus]|nr:hypothetical protein DFH11DRAFT_1724511 [Phellopilus nigrolimitatus]
MRSDKCGECGEEFVWDSDAGSAVCTGCGTLQDPSQVLLDSHIDPADDGKDHYVLAFQSRSTLKSFRSASGWDLAGQGKLAAAERNKISMRQYTEALAKRIGHPALSTRALYLFELAMEKGRFRYGKKARLVSGASLAIALREGQKGETIKDIAYLLDETPVALARTFTMVVALLEVKLTSVDPSWHFPALQKQIVEMLAGCSPSLPPNLTKVLKTIHLPTALRSALSLSELISRSGLLTHVPSPPTACAIYILALEGEVLSSLPHCGDLAKALGMRFGVSKDLVMRRYKTIYEQIEGWAASVPWLADSGDIGGRKATSKVAKRVVVARCLKDVVQFQAGVWRAKLEASEPLSAPDDEVESVSSSEISSSSEVDLQRTDEASTSQPLRPRKRRKTRHIDDVSQFLLSPLHLPASSSKKAQNDAAPSLDVASHLLTTDSPSFKHPPTRLQLLAAEKSVEEIADEELFAEGELEGFLRNAEEREVLMKTCDWAREKDGDDGALTVRTRRRDRERGGASRVNIEVLNRLFNEPESNGWVEATNEDDDKDDDSWAMKGIAEQIMTSVDQFESSGRRSQLAAIDDNDDDDSLRPAPLAANDTDEIVEPWRPLSPAEGPSWDSYSRYVGT